VANPDPTIFELGESDALAQAVKHFKPGSHTLVPSGDDAAVIRSNGRYVVTTDTMVQDRDFRHEFSSGYDLGFKAVGSNLADVVAMGANPTALVVAMVVPTSFRASWLSEFARGLQAGIDELSPGCEVVGGDLAAGEQLVIAVTAHGELDQEPVLRSGAKVGDQVVVAGTLGRAACGLSLLMSPDPTLAAAYPEWVAIQLRPQPPLQIGLELSRIATSMLDLSDGLSSDAARIAKASSVSLKLSSSALLGYEAVLELAAQSMTARGFQANERDWVLHGGEDHSFLATVPPGMKLPLGCKVIGEVIDKSEHPVFLDEKPLVAKGWDSISS
jgi:thiamine-monophosphate kinase